MSRIGGRPLDPLRCTCTLTIWTHYGIQSLAALLQYPPSHPKRTTHPRHRQTSQGHPHRPQTANLARKTRPEQPCYKRFPIRAHCSIAHHAPEPPHENAPPRNLTNRPAPTVAIAPSPSEQLCHPAGRLTPLVRPLGEGPVHGKRLLHKLGAVHFLNGILQRTGETLSEMWEAE